MRTFAISPQSIWTLWIGHFQSSAPVRSPIAISSIVLTDRLNAPVQGTGAESLKLALALLWERRDECPGAVPVLVCHDEIVVECDEDRGEETKRWLEQAMIEGMDAVINGTDEVDAPVEVGARIARSWGESDLLAPEGSGGGSRPVPQCSSALR
jgi:DNA polymerase family A